MKHLHAILPLLALSCPLALASTPWGDGVEQGAWSQESNNTTLAVDVCAFVGVNPDEFGNSTGIYEVYGADVHFTWRPLGLKRRFGFSITAGGKFYGGVGSGVTKNGVNVDTDATAVELNWGGGILRPC